MVAGASLIAVACWGSSLKAADATRLNKCICKASDIVGLEVDSLVVAAERRMLSKLRFILDTDSHPASLAPPSACYQYYIQHRLQIYSISLGLCKILSQEQL